MAGIGFELRKLLDKAHLTGVLQAYMYAAVIGSGPWVLSIVGILIVGTLSTAAGLAGAMLTQFQVSVTYLIAVSLILTGPVQLSFTRFISDELYRERTDSVLPNLNGMLLLVAAVSGVIGVVVMLLWFGSTGLGYRLMMLGAFVLLCEIWVATLLLSGLRQYREIVLLYALGYGIVIGAALLLRPLGMEGLLLGFVLGHLVLFIGMLLLVVRGYPSTRFIAFDFLRPGAMLGTLMLSGLLYNLAVWADKFLFWMSEDTGQAVIGPLRASPVYDLPLFLAYLSIIPGMAVFLTRMETDFVDYYTRFYDKVRSGGTLDELEDLRDEMVLVVKQGLGEIVKIQSIAVLAVFALSPGILRAVGISELNLPLFHVHVIAAGLQVVLLGLLNVFFYLDKQRIVVFLTAVFAVANLGLTWLSLAGGAPYYAYGFAISALIAVLLATALLSRKLETLEYETFMLQ